MRTVPRMKKLYESELHGENESASKITVFLVKDWCMFNEISEMSHEERCELFNVTDESLYPYAVMPGASYNSYSFILVYPCYLIVEETISLNV